MPTKRELLAEDLRAVAAKFTMLANIASGPGRDDQVKMLIRRGVAEARKRLDGIDEVLT